MLVPIKSLYPFFELTSSPDKVCKVDAILRSILLPIINAQPEAQIFLDSIPSGQKYLAHLSMDAPSKPLKFEAAILVSVTMCTAAQINIFGGFRFFGACNLQIEYLVFHGVSLPFNANMIDTHVSRGFSRQAVFLQFFSSLKFRNNQPPNQ